MCVCFQRTRLGCKAPAGCLTDSTEPAAGSERIESIQAHIALLKQMHQIANERHKVGKATLKDVLVAQIQLAEARVKDESP